MPVVGHVSCHVSGAGVELAEGHCFVPPEALPGAVGTASQVIPSAKEYTEEANTACVVLIVRDNETVRV